MSEDEITPEIAEAARRYLTEMIECKVCPVCHQPLTGKEQVGRCVYGQPCGCRMYQGDVSLGTGQKGNEHA